MQSYSISYRLGNLLTGDTGLPVLSGLSAESAIDVLSFLLNLDPFRWVILDLTVSTMDGELVAVDHGPFMDSRPAAFIRRHAGI
jgi:hypothetical protein